MKKGRQGYGERERRSSEKASWHRILSHGRAQEPGEIPFAHAPPLALSLAIMSDHIARLRWRRQTPDFDLKTYNRDLEASFKGGKPIKMSASLAYKGSADAIDPEEMLVGAIASCHMLSFLALAAGRKLVVDSYEDDATGALEKNADSRLAVTRVTLRPNVIFSGAKPDASVLDELHHKAHEACFIANSVKCEITIETPVHA